jgi:MinD superfamily P-loop ATPase
MGVSPSANVVPWVDYSMCQGCHQCTARNVCRTKAIRAIDPGEPPFIDAHLCMGCHDCVAACPVGAIVRPHPPDLR